MSEKKLISEVSEFGLISRISGLLSGGVAALGPAGIGIGDDCAVISGEAAGAGGNLLITTDSMVAGRHFDPSFSSAADVGHKLVATTLSDIAAMGGRSLCLVINIQLPRMLELEWLDNFYSEADKAAAAAGSVIAGGNTTAANELSFCATAIGVCDGKPVLRSGAGAGDDLWVSGGIGFSYLGLQILQSKFDRGRFPDGGEAALRCYQRPQARLALGQKLCGVASAMLDVSDGLLQDAGHIAKASGTDLEIDESLLPLPGAALSEREKVECMAGGGDYELLFCAPQSQRAVLESLSMKGCSLTLIGRAAAPADAGPKVRLLRACKTAEELVHGVGLAGLGHDHFA